MLRWFRQRHLFLPVVPRDQRADLFPPYSRPPSPGPSCHANGSTASLPGNDRSSVITPGASLYRPGVRKTDTLFLVRDRTGCLNSRSFGLHAARAMIERVGVVRRPELQGSADRARRGPASGSPRRLDDTTTESSWHHGRGGGRPEAASRLAPGTRCPGRATGASRTRPGDGPDEDDPGEAELLKTFSKSWRSPRPPGPSRAMTGRRGRPSSSGTRSRRTERRRSRRACWPSSPSVPLVPRR
jgi:hypothetical protein